MSSLTVLCPNGHRVKVTTNPNMSLQAVLETAASKKGFETSEHILEFHKKRLDMSSTIRFSGMSSCYQISFNDSYFKLSPQFSVSRVAK